MPPSDNADRHRAKKSLGQNFLIDPNLQRKIVEALDLTPDDEVLEIGPGMGALTRHLVGRARRLVLVELDNDLVARLQAEHAGDPSVQIVHSDILEAAVHELVEEPSRLKVIGNIPYNITTPILFHLLEILPRPAVIVLMVQREVADRILAAHGSKQYGALAVGVQAVAAVERVLQVGRNAFRPVPDVESSLIRVTPHTPPPLPPDEERALRQLTRIAFGQRRKQLQRILRDRLHLSHEQIATLEADSGMRLTDRPERFSPPQFIQLARLLHARKHLGG